MPFVVIRGAFHLVSRSANGAEQGFQPDGDSIQFKPDNLALLDRLTQLKRPYHLSAIGSTQLRFEGIDALELHFQGAARHQPRPLADQARDFLTGLLDLNPVPYTPPDNITVQPPVPHDATRGYILSRSLEVNGRPVSFVFAGETDDADGAEVFLDTEHLKTSLNYALLQSGNAYPLFYETLFADLRAELTTVAQQARNEGKGLWPQDVSQTGVTVSGPADLEEKAVIFPKLFRRLSEYLGLGIGGLDGFLAWVASTLEQVTDLTTMNTTHFDNLITVQDNVVRLTKQPDQLVFISAK